MDGDIEAVDIVSFTDYALLLVFFLCSQSEHFSPLPILGEGALKGRVRVFYMSKTIRARELRKASTEVEKILWSRLKNRRLNNLKFKRQFVIEYYIVDFICLEKKLIIELDGSQHLDNEQYDAERTAFLNEKGYNVIRFWNNVILKNLELVLEKIIFEAE